MQLHDRYDDDPSTHLELDLNLWLEVGSSSGLYRNWVYSISNTRVEDMWARRSVSTIKSLQSASSSQSSQFQLILSQQIKTRTTHLATEIEQLNAKMTELQQLYMELKSYMGSTCGPSHWSQPIPVSSSSSSSFNPFLLDKLYWKWLILKSVINI
jgi:hypothetical protein